MTAAQFRTKSAWKKKNREMKMDAAELRAMQAPIKERYKSDPSAAVITLKAKGSIDNEGIACKVETCLLYTSPSPRDGLLSRMPSSA